MMLVLMFSFGNSGVRAKLFYDIMGNVYCLVRFWCRLVVVWFFVSFLIKM